jgi:hypothetical protein
MQNYTTLHNTSQKLCKKLYNKNIQNYTQLYTTIHNYTQLHTTLHNLTQLYKTLQNFTKLSTLSQNPVAIEFWNKQTPEMKRRIKESNRRQRELLRLRKKARRL